MKTMQQLEALIEDYSHRALAYYLNFEMAERRLPQELRLKIKEKYGSEKFMPTMNWKEHFEPGFPDSEAMDRLILEYLERQGYDKEKFILPADRLKNYLWNKARERGRKILDDLK